MRLLQVFGIFDNQPTLRSFDQGVLGDVNVSNINITVSCHKISAEKLDLILDELKRIEPEFTLIKPELRTIIQEKMAQPIPPIAAESSSFKGFDLHRTNAEKIASTHRTLAHLMQSIFNQHGIRRTSEESNVQRASRLLSAGQYQAALTCIRQYNSEVMDSNPYPYGSEKGASVSIAIDTYRIMANCYKNLHQYSEAISTLDEMDRILHNVLFPRSLQEITDTRNKWQAEANAYAAEQTQQAQAGMGMD